jgi:hypothetical protein
MGQIGNQLGLPIRSVRVTPHLLLVGHNPLQPGVLSLRLLQPLNVIGLEAAVLGPPPVIGGLAGLQLLGHLGHLAALGQQPVGLAQLADDLLWGVASSLHGVLLPVGQSDSHTSWTKLRGSGQNHQSAFAGDLMKLCSYEV